MLNKQDAHPKSVHNAMFRCVLFCLFICSLLAGCETQGIDFNHVDAVTEHPYTEGSRIRAPEKGNCLVYAIATKYQLKRLCGIDSRIITMHIYDEDHRQKADHAIVAYTAPNGRLHLVDNNHKFPVLAKRGDDTTLCNQMMPASCRTEVIDHNYDPLWLDAKIQEAIDLVKTENKVLRELALFRRREGVDFR